MDQPIVILLISGKRKCGKDYLCERLKSFLEEKCAILRISGPLKGLYAEKHGLDLKELLSDGPYKEKYRLDMIIWSDEVRKEEPGHFCKAACEGAPTKPIWIVSDIRRKTDIKWFKDTYPDKIKTIRVLADLEIRKSRGWVFAEGVDDVQSECDLDDYSEWDFVLSNNNKEESEDALKTLLDLANEYFR